MAPQKRLRNAKYSTARKGGKIRKRHHRKTVRGHRHSTAGKIFPPLDVRNPKQLNHIMERITKGPVTVLVVYADWCGHCHKLMPHVKSAANVRGRNVQIMSIRDDMLSGYNTKVNSFNRAASPIEVDGYPSVLLVNQNGEKISEIAPTKEALESAMVNVAPVALEAGIATGLAAELETPKSLNSINKRNAIKPRNGSPEEIVEDIVENDLVVPEKNTSAVNEAVSFEHLENDNIISDGEEPIEIGESALDVGVSPAIKNLTFSSNANARKPSANRVITQTVPINAVSKNKLNNTEGLSKHDAEEITSLRAEPVSPGAGSDTRPIKAVVGGGNRGGSLYGIMSQSAYRLAPAAVLLATAAAVMKKKTRSKRSMVKKGAKRSAARSTKRRYVKKR